MGEKQLCKQLEAWILFISFLWRKSGTQNAENPTKYTIAVKYI